MMKKATGTTKRGTGGVMKTKGMNNSKTVGKASPGRTTKATYAKKKG